MFSKWTTNTQVTSCMNIKSVHFDIFEFKKHEPRFSGYDSEAGLEGQRVKGPIIYAL